MPYSRRNTVFVLIRPSLFRAASACPTDKHRSEYQIQKPYGCSTDRPPYRQATPKMQKEQSGCGDQSFHIHQKTENQTEKKSSASFWSVHVQSLLILCQVGSMYRSRHHRHRRHYRTRRNKTLGRTDRRVQSPRQKPNMFVHL